MDALRRGWVGLALFSAALILMPVLVFGYDKGDQPGRRSQLSSTTVPQGVQGLQGLLEFPVTAAPNVEGLSFDGVREGEILAGFRLIRVVASAHYGGALEFVLNGPIPPWQASLSRPPYTFAPSVGGQGWQTTEVPNGLYTLTAIPTGAASSSISVSFTVRNTLSPDR
jgi:hypothetical protein